MQYLKILWGFNRHGYSQTMSGRIANLQKVFQTIAWCILIIAACLFYSSLLMHTPHLTPDSTGYIEYAFKLKTGMPLSAHSSYSIRTVVYPFIIAFSSLNQFDNYSEIILVHLALHLFTLYLLIKLTSDKIDRIYIVVIFLLFAWSLDVFAVSILSEWVAAHILLLVYAITWRYIEVRKIIYLPILGISVCLLTLTRPVFAFTLVLPLLLASVFKTPVIGQKFRVYQKIKRIN